MSDMASELRDWAVRCGEQPNGCRQRAADEIDRLRAEIVAEMKRTKLLVDTIREQQEIIERLRADILNLVQPCAFRPACTCVYCQKRLEMFREMVSEKA